MHPGPMNRGVEIDSSVADGAQSVILPQVTFGIAVRMAVMSTAGGGKMNIHIKNGRLIDPQNKIDAQQDVFIADKHIAGHRQGTAGFVAEQVIDASGLIVMPGLVDVAARLREPGYEYKATLESEMDAAMAGGVTSLSCPPDTDPPLDEPGLVEMLKHRARSLNQARVFPVGALTYGLKGAELTEMIELTEAGCKAFSQADAPLTDTRVLMRAMQYAATFGYRVWLRPQDTFLAKDGVAHDGEVATRLGLPAIPVVAETIALSTMLQLARETGVKLHVCRISSAEGVEMVRVAKSQGLAVTCDVSMNHVHLSEMDIGYLRFQLPSDAAAAQPARQGGTARRACSTERSTRSAPTTRRWMRMPNNCRSPKPRRAQPAWNCCCRWC